LSNLDNEIHNPYTGNASYVGLAPLMHSSSNGLHPLSHHHALTVMQLADKGTNKIKVTGIVRRLKFGTA